MNNEPIIKSDSSVVPRPNAEFASGIQLGLGGSLDVDDMMRRILGSIHEVVILEYPEDMPQGATPTRVRWNAYRTGSLEVTIVNGDVEFGGKVKAQDFPVILWADITKDAGISSTGVVTIPASQLTWAVWVEVDLRYPDEAVYLRHAVTIEQLSDSEGDARWIDSMIQKEIARITLVDDVITAVEGDLQCGNIFIPRAAG